MNCRKIRQLNAIREKQGFCEILIHTDAAQAIGKVSVDAQALGIDYLTIVGHKVKFFFFYMGLLTYVQNSHIYFWISFMGLETGLFMCED